MNKWLLVIIFFFCSVCISFGQGNWTIYNASNSPLPDDIITQVVEDNDGNIWFSTDDGPVKFDGVNWTVWDTTNTGIQMNYLAGMAYDKVNDILWVTQPGLLLNFDGAVWSSWNYSPKAVDMAIDHNGNIWQAHFNGGISVFDGTIFTFYDTTNSPLPNNKVWTVDVSPTNEIWITSSYGLSRFDGTNWTVYDTIDSQLPSNYTTAVAFDSSGFTWVQGENGQEGFLYYYDGSTWNSFDTTVCMPPAEHCDIAIDIFNRKWIGSGGDGLTVLGDTSCAYYKSNNSPLPSNDILDVFITSDNIIWIATYDDGLARLDLTVGLPEFNQNEGYEIFPNPASEYFTVTSHQMNIKRIIVFNSIGQKVMYFDKLATKMFELNLEAVSRGIYMILVENEAGQSGTYKLVVE